MLSFQGRGDFVQSAAWTVCCMGIPIDVEKKQKDVDLLIIAYD